MAVLASRNWRGGGRCRFRGLLVPLAPLPLTTARVGAGTLVVFGDYQIAPIAARSTAMGRWRLTPPGYGGDTACGCETIPGGDKYYACAGGEIAPAAGTRGFTPLRGDTSSVSFADTCLPAGRSAGLTGHRPVIQRRGPPRGKAFFARGRFFWLCLSLFVCLSLFGGAGQAGQRQE